MSGFHGQSDFLKITFISLLLSGLFLIIAYFFPYWTTRYDGHAGLWWGCTDGLCYERWNLWVEPWVRATQLIMTLALITWTASCIFVFLFIYHRYFDEDRRMIFLATVSAFLTSLFLLVSVITWAAGSYLGDGEVLNWAYAFVCFCFVINFGAGFLLLLEMRTPVR